MPIVASRIAPSLQSYAPSTSMSAQHPFKLQARINYGEHKRRRSRRVASILLRARELSAEPRARTCALVSFMRLLDSVSLQAPPTLLSAANTQ